MTGALLWYWLAVVLPWSRSARRSLARVFCLPLGLWLAGMFAGGAVGFLLADPKNMGLTVAGFYLQALGGAVGGMWGVHRAGRPGW